MQFYEIFLVKGQYHAGVLPLSLSSVAHLCSTVYVFKRNVLFSGLSSTNAANYICTAIETGVADLLHVSKYVHATTKEVLSLLTVQLVDKLCRVVVVGILVPTMHTIMYADKHTKQQCVIAQPENALLVSRCKL